MEAGVGSAETPIRLIHWDTATDLSRTVVRRLGLAAGLMDSAQSTRRGQVCASYWPSATGIGSLTDQPLNT